MWASSRWTLIGLLAIGGGCDSCCDGGILADATRRPDNETAERHVRKHLETAAEVASAMCGVSAKGLAVESITVTQGKLDVPGFGTAQIKGKPILDVDGGVELAKGLLCIGAVTFALSLKTRDGEEVWELYVLRVSEVKTPGVTWTPPPPSDGDD
jgi:hypothetical protein